MKKFTLCFLICCGISLAGCTGTMGAAYSSLEVIFAGSPGPRSLDPRYEYLHLSTPDSEVTLALGYREVLNQANNASLETWVSADKNTFRLEGGRYAGSHRLRINWRDVHAVAAPELSTVEGAQTYVRERTIDPGLIQTHQETVQVAPIPNRLAPDWAPQDLREGAQWLVESILEPQISPNQPIVAYYARDPQSKNILWATQCLGRGYCIAWRRL